MAFELVHTFTIGITNYYIVADYDTEEVQMYVSPPGPAPSSVTSGELGFGPGDVMQYRCFGTVKKSVIAQLTPPFGSMLIEADSSDCGYTPPSCDFNYTSSVVNAVNGNNNGQITMYADYITPGRTYQFSLDNVGWQTSPVFNFLFAGSYQVYVRDQIGCLKTYIINVGNDVVDNPILPSEIPFADAKRICYFFRLIIDGVTHVVREPIKWDDVNIIGERDADYHGYNFKYTDGNVNLGFDCAAGKELIEAVYAEKGQDGEILFEYGYSYDGTDYVLFPGRLMLNTLKFYPEKVECTVETQDVDTVFTSRMDVKVSMNQDKTFDNENVSPPAPYGIELHAKKILAKFLSNRSDILFETSGASLDVQNHYIKPDNQEPTYSEITDNYQYPLGNQTSAPLDIDEYSLDLKSGGTAEYSINLDIDFLVTKFIATPGVDYTAKVILLKKKFNPGTNAYDLTYQDITTTPVAGTFGIFTTSFNIKGSISATESFLKDDKLYCYVHFVVTPAHSLKFKLTQNNFTFEFNYLEETASTNSNGWFIEDVARHCINVIGNNRYAFRSSFFERKNVNQIDDGCGSKNIITNGFQIRQFEVDSRPLKIDFKTVLKSMKAQWCIGLNYSNDSQGPYVRIERADYFYRDREILAIYELESYREEVANDIIYNELEYGFEKYQDSGYNSLDEFNTKHQALTPIKKNKKKLSQLSSFIASGYAIETIRREQFRDKPSSSVTNDEEPFIIAVKRIDIATWETEKDEAFETVTGIISPETSYNLRHSPKRNLYNWFIWLKGIFAYKEDTDKITITDLKQNNEMITRFNSTEPCRVGDADRVTIAEKDPVPMTEMDTTAAIYQPERAFIKCRLSPQDVQIINLAMTGRYGSTKDHGYLLVKKPNGDWQAIWIEKLSYNYWTEKAEISGLKKYFSLDEPQEPPCCEWLVVNGCYLMVNATRLIA